MPRLSALLVSMQRVSWQRARILLGCFAWSVTLLALPLGWAEALLLFAALVLLPLCLELLSRRESWRPERFERVTVAIQFPGALALAGSFALPPGIPAAVLACPWLLFTILMARRGASELILGGRRSIGDICVNAGLIYLAVGGSWTVISRAGWRPLEFRDIIVLATAVHFHYAGFILPLLAGWTASVLRDTSSRIAAIGVVIGVPAVAAGITLSAFQITFVEWLAAWFLAGSSLLVAVQHLRLAARASGWLGRISFGISGTSLFLAMLLAAVYGLRAYWGIEWLDIPEMLPFHGAVNAFGFALPGLLAWRIAPPTGARSGSLR